MQPLQLAVIGAGGIGARHARVVAQSDAARLAALCDPDPRAAELAAALGARHHGDLAALLAGEALDGVIVATPTATHADVAARCLAAGRPVLVEKPIAATVAEAREMVEAAQRAGVPLLVGHHRRFNPLVEAAREIVRGGELGRLVAASGIWAARKSDDYFAVTWRTQPGGGPILTNLVHDIDLLRWVCGDIARIHAESSHAARGHAVEDSVCVALRFVDGALGTLFCSDATPAPWSYELNTGENPAFPQVAETCYQFMGTRAALAFPGLALWHYPDAAASGWLHPLARTERSVPAADPLVRQVEHFCRVIRGAEAPRTSGADGLRTLEATLAVAQAAQQGVPVVLGEAAR